MTGVQEKWTIDECRPTEYTCGILHVVSVVKALLSTLNRDGSAFCTIICSKSPMYDFSPEL